MVTAQRRMELGRINRTSSKTVSSKLYMIASWYEAEKEKLSPIWQRQNLEFPSLDTLK
jgi:hypothetical protein